jgi:DNA-binding MarR family transcriptional regulator
MMAAGLIREADKRVDPAMDDERRIYYALTALGRRALTAELDRYREVVAVATEKGVARSAMAHG